MDYKIREQLFNKMMVFIRKILYFILKLDKHKKFEKFLSNDGYIPLLSYNVKLKHYRFNCYCLDCPINLNGLCQTRFKEIPFFIMHNFDNDNTIKNFCG